MPPPSALQRALDQFEGSPTKMAAAIGGEVKRQHIEHWLKSGRVPPEHCPAVSDLTGVALWDLRPDDWYRIWPMVIDKKGAPDVPAESSKESHSAAPSNAPAAAPASRQRDHREPRQDAHKDKPSNLKGR